MDVDQHRHARSYGESLVVGCGSFVLMCVAALALAHALHTGGAPAAVAACGGSVVAVVGYVSLATRAGTAKRAKWTSAGKYPRAAGDRVVINHGPLRGRFATVTGFGQGVHHMSLYVEVDDDDGGRLEVTYDEFDPVSDD